ncbi:MAG: hypothetical protein J3R72DRAFT_471572 [Linnemannia gamsii]|nr:MAG: hypothetical protein J3R72DRAFT_471572 [Linnemannia gamsii]
MPHMSARKMLAPSAFRPSLPVHVLTRAIASAAMLVPTVKFVPYRVMMLRSLNSRIGAVSTVAINSGTTVGIPRSEQFVPTVIAVVMNSPSVKRTPLKCRRQSLKSNKTNTPHVNSCHPTMTPLSLSWRTRK